VYPLKVGFRVKYGYNEIEIPITDKTVSKFQKNGKTDLFSSKVTIYNDIPSDGVNARRFDRFVIDLCNIQGGVVSKTDGTIENIVNAQTIITKDVKRYKSPLEYATIPVDLREDFFTVQIGDFIVFDEIEDIVTTSREFAELQSEYADNGMVVRSVSANINRMSVDNVTITNVG
jgi:hypothetical protein